MLLYDKNMQIFSTIAYALVILITLVVRHFFKDKSDFAKRLPTYIIGIILVFLELCKQIRNLAGYNYRFFFAIFRGQVYEFDAYALPFHFCSFFVFWIIFEFIFFKKKRIRNFFENMAFLWSTFIFVLVFFYPTMIYGDSIPFLFENHELDHTTIFHLLVILYFGISLSLRTYDFKLKRIYEAPICMLIFGAFAIPAAHIFKKNFCSIYSNEGWDFLQPVFDKGYFIYNSVLIIIGIIVSFILYLSILGIEKLRDKVKDNKLYIYGYYASVIGVFILLLISKSTGYEKLQSLYPIYLSLVAFICCLPATIKGHFLTKHN